MSDQDFFFDDDEEIKQSAPKESGAKRSPSKSAGAATTPAAETAMTNPTTIIVLVGVIALLLGTIAGIFIGQSMASSSVPAVTVPATGGTTEQAPQLTPEQMEGGELPEGHPSIGDAEGGSTEPTEPTQP